MAVSLPPGKYAIYPAISATTPPTFSTSLAVQAPNNAGQPVTVQSTASPPGTSQQWVVFGDGRMQNLGSNTYFAIADEGNAQVLSTATAPTQFLISVTAQSTIPGWTNTPGWIGTIKTPDAKYYSWNYAGTGNNVQLVSQAVYTSIWAFIPVA